MNTQDPDQREPVDREEGAAAVPREPIFLLPTGIVGALAVLWAVHIGSLVLPEMRPWLWQWLGFIPFRVTEPGLVPGGVLPMVWTPFSHALLHADWMHLIFNSAWLAIFGTPVARRYGTGPLLGIFLSGAAAGALTMLASMLIDAVQFTVLIGASGGVAALTGAAVRFVFQPVVFARDPSTGQRVALGRRTASMGEIMANRSARAFVIIWLGLNLAIPLAPLVTGGVAVPIAWQAHIGGFVLGLFAPSLIDRSVRSS